VIYGANYDFEMERVLEPTWLWRHDLVMGERLALARPDKTAYFAPALSPDGQHVIYQRAGEHPSERQVWIVG